MKFYRNPEIRRSIWLWALWLAAFAAAAACLDWRFGALSSAFGLLCGALHFVPTFRRYRALAELSLEIDEILHGSVGLDLDRFAEGELAVLQSEIYKMTVRLREQAENLKKDKVYLADSIADISHQIRTPLTSINLVVNFLGQEGLEEERRIALVQELRGLLGRIDWLIGTLLKLSRLDAGTVRFARSQVNVREMLGRAAQPVEIPMDLRGQRLVLKSSGEETFYGDLAWTTEAVENILKNCMEHTPEGGCITAEARETPIFTEIVISDTGEGIDEKDLPRLFERFYRGEHAAEGSAGIGLALARMIVTEQDGSLKAGNRPGGGAEFTIRFYRATR